MKEEYLKYCRYYKGEDKPPYENTSFEHSLWIYEKSFFERVYEQDREKYNEYVSSGSAKHDFPQLSAFFDSHAYPASKALIAHIAILIDSMSPIGEDAALKKLSQIINDKYNE